jgi:hypothetical protein
MNIQIRKFFDATAVEPAAAPSVAELMAKHGINNQGSEMVATPVAIPEKKEDPPPAPEPTPAATAIEPPKAEQAQPESPSPTPEPIVVPTPPIAAEPPKVPTWQEVLKQQQPDAIFKEIGLDADAVNLAKEIRENQQMMAFYNHWKNNGDVTSYLKELSTDYSKMPAEEVMRHQLRQEYPKATEKQLDLLFHTKVAQAYNLTSEDPEQVENGRLLLEAEADRHRDKLVQNQQNFLLPKPPEPKAAEPDLRAQQQQQSFEEYQSAINNSPYTASLLATKKLAIGEGDEKFNYPIADPSAITNILMDTEAWERSFFTVETKPDGTKKYVPDVEKQLFVAAAMHDYKGLLKELGIHFKSLGGKSALDLIENPSKTNNDQPTATIVEPQSAAAAMAKSGKLVN